MGGCCHWCHNCLRYTDCIFTCHLIYFNKYLIIIIITVIIIITTATIIIIYHHYHPCYIVTHTQEW